MLSIQDEFQRLTGKKHIHWCFLAYEGELPGSELKKASRITVVDYDSEADALGAAKKILIRPFYFLEKCWECTSCKNQEDIFALLRRKLEP